MATDRAEVLKKAEKLLRTGKLELAIAEYVRLVEQRPTDWNVRHTLGDLYVRANQPYDAIAEFTRIADHLFTEGDHANAAALYRKILTVSPGESQARRRLQEMGVAPEAAIQVSVDPVARLAQLETALRSGDVDAGRQILATLPHADAALQSRILELGWALSPVSPDGAYLCIERAVDAELAAGNYTDGAALLQEFATRVPGQIVALLKLIDICVRGGLEATMYETQAQLADTYLALEQGAEARALAEDLVAREPWEPAHIDRFRRALQILRVPDPDAVIAERLSGQGPFIATDPFAPPVDEPEQSEQPSPERDPAPAVPPVEEPAPEPLPKRDPEPTPAPRRVAKEPSGLEIDLSDVLSQLQAPAEDASAEDASAEDAPPDEEEEEINLDGPFDEPPSDESRQAGMREAAEQLDLARTYLDMGMPDEAITALTRAAKIPTYRFVAASLLGRLYLKKDDSARALEWLERAAEAPAPSADEGRELLYDLGATLETAGEVSRALAVFMELQADAGEYRDVAARVDRLARAQTGG